jgi:hypothetical protein
VEVFEYPEGDPNNPVAKVNNEPTEVSIIKEER